MKAGGSDRGWYCWNHCWSATADQGPRHPVDYFRQEQRCCAYKFRNFHHSFISNASIQGGTWFENIYPGVRCDIPSHCYQSTYSPKVDWSEEYAQGNEIKNYWQSLARKFDVHSKCRFQTKVNSAQWIPEDAKWRLNVSDLAASTVDDFEFDFIITANGHFNEWKLPSYPGIEKFKGHLRHSSNWDPNFDPKGKRIATIGNGASGIQVTTALQKQAAHVDHYARNKTWIAGSFNPSTRERQEAAMPFSEEQLRDFQDPEKYLAFRKQLEGTFFRRFESILRDSDTTRKGAEAFKQIMRERLGDDAELLEKMVPDFPPFCRRLTPGPGYLEAITKDNLTFIQDPIDHFTEDGIVTKDGVHRQVDAVICSTGANVDFAPPFPIVAGDYDLSKDWKPDGKFGFPYSYLGLFTPHFPNCAYILGKRLYRVIQPFRQYN
jgi:cation diffusion facilitator CzcD-associated flavoprotein CzcO